MTRLGVAELVERNDSGVAGSAGRSPRNTLVGVLLGDDGVPLTLHARDLGDPMQVGVVDLRDLVDTFHEGGKFPNCVHWSYAARTGTLMSIDSSMVLICAPWMWLSHSNCRSEPDLHRFEQISVGLAAAFVPSASIVTHPGVVRVIEVIAQWVISESAG